MSHIVSAQQQFAQISGVVDDVDPSEPVEYALRLCEAELLRHQIIVIRDYQPARPIRIERHKAVQIIVNLLRNAKDSLARSGLPDKQIRAGVRVTSEGRAQCYIADNGEGLSAAQLSRIFTMGFTTKKGGHGFGLHNSAITASSLGGTLEAHSDGEGKGATFILNLPAPAASLSG